MMNSQVELKVLTLDEVAQYLRVSKNTAYALCVSAGFPAVKVGRRIRVPLQAFEQWLMRPSRR